MKRKCIGILLLVMALLLTGCGSVQPEAAFDTWENQVQNDMATAEGAWTYTLDIHKQEMTCEDADGRTLVVGSYEQPVMQVFHPDGTPYSAMTESNMPAMQVAQQVNRFFADQMKIWQTNFDEICALARQDSRKNAAAWENEEYLYSDSVEAVFWHNSRIACITLTTDSFTGGAHGVRSRSAVTFDMSTGREITINDMVDDYAALRDTVALEILRQIDNGRYVKYYNGKLLFSDYQETIPEWMTRAIFFGDGEMTVVFGAYDIAAYAAGEQAFTIPYSLIAPYLNAYGKTALEIE